METDRIRVGVIGIGNMGSVHAKSLFEDQIAGMSLAAVCDTDSNRLNWASVMFNGVPLFSDYQAMLDANLVDAIIIATPHYMHCPIAIKGFENRLHVLCEKPAGVYTKEVKTMNYAALQAKTVFSLMFNQRTDPIYSSVRDMVRNGVLGKPQRLLWTVTNWYRTQAYYESSAWRATWVGEGGGVLLNQAVHNLDLWQWIFGMPSRITGFCSFGKYHDIEVEDEVAIYADYDSTATAVFITTTGEFPGTNRLEIAGTEGKIVAEGGRLIHWENNEDFTYSQQEDITPAIVGQYGHNVILQNFSDAIRMGTPLIAPGAEGLSSLQIANATLLSVWENRTVNLPVDGDLYFDWLQKKISASRKKMTVPDQPTGLHNSRWNINW